MRNGIFSLHFQSSLGLNGTGSLEIRNGNLRGGDDEFLYIGTYTAIDSRFYAQVRIKRFQGDTESIFGDLDQFSLDLQGKQTYNSFFATGMLEKAQNISLTVEGELIEPLQDETEHIALNTHYSRLASLTERSPHLADLNNFTQLAQVDIEACLNKLRKVGERLTLRILNTLGHPPARNFNTAIGVLQTHQVLSQKTISYLHTVRTIGNLASHSSGEALTYDDVRLAAFAMASIIEDMLDRNII